MQKKLLIIALSMLFSCLLFYSDDNQLLSYSNNHGFVPDSKCNIVSENNIAKKVKLAIPAIYGDVNNFSNGFASVRYNKVKRLHFLVTQKAVKEFIKRKLYLFFIDKNGRRINRNSKYLHTGNFSKDGYAYVGEIAVKGSDRVAIINSKGRMVFPWKYAEFRNFYRRTIPVRYSMAHRSFGFMRRYGNSFRVIKKASYLSIDNFSEGLVQVQVNLRNNQYGYADMNGRLVIPARYSDATPFSEGLAAVQLSGQRKYGYINKKGKWLIRPRFEHNVKFPFRNGRAMITRYKKAQGSRYPEPHYGYIDRTGKLVIPLNYRTGFNFSEGLACVSKLPYGKGKYHFIDTSGHVVFNGKMFDDAGSFKEGLAFAKASGKYGFINKKGEWIIRPQFEKAKDLSDGMAAVQVNGRWGFICHP